MSLKRKALVWVLEHRPDLFFRLKKAEMAEVSRDPEFLALHLDLLRDDRGTQTLHERYNLYSLGKATTRLAGAMAEAGVYRGGTAKLFCKIKGDTPLYLFDTFEGLPPVDKKIDPGFGTGQFSETSLELVKDYLKAYPNVHFYPGFFPASAQGQEPERQSYRFVHLDLDLYQSTFDALGFFYSKMVRGGIIVSHDYNNVNAGGVKRAFHEFFADKVETIIPLWDTQCVICKA